MIAKKIAQKLRTPFNPKHSEGQTLAARTMLLNFMTGQYSTYEEFLQALKKSIVSEAAKTWLREKAAEFYKIA